MAEAKILQRPDRTVTIFGAWCVASAYRGAGQPVEDDEGRADGADAIPGSVPDGFFRFACCIVVARFGTTGFRCRGKAFCQPADFRGDDASAGKESP